MKFLIGAAIVLVFGEARLAAEERRVVTVCMNTGGQHQSHFYVARGLADKILGQAGVDLEWRKNEEPCAGLRNSLIIKISNAQANSFPGALAYTDLRRHQIEVFQDRVILAANGNGQIPAVLGHVLAHEIVHALQGLARHSETGLMMRRWTISELSDMCIRPLSLDIADVSLIHRGLNRWAAENQAALMNQNNFPPQ